MMQLATVYLQSQLHDTHQPYNETQDNAILCIDNDLLHQPFLGHSWTTTEKRRPSGEKWRMTLVVAAALTSRKKSVTLLLLLLVLLMMMMMIHHQLNGRVVMCN